MSKAVAETKETMNEIVTFDASIFEQDAGMGMGDLSQDDMAIPFLKVLSRQDPVLDDLDNAKAGDILNTVSNQVYAGKTGIRVIPCAYQRRYLEWAPRGSGNGAPLNIYTPEDKRPRTERGDDNKDYVVGGQGTYIEETHQHYVLILNEDGTTTTAVIAMKSTQLKKSRKWNSMMMSRVMQGSNGAFTPPRFSHIYHLKTIQEENSKGSWHGWEMSVEGPVQDIAMYQQAKKFSEDIMSDNVVVKHVDDQDGGGESIPF